MGFKIDLIVLYLFVSLSAFPQTEEQRKYAIEDYDNFTDFIINSESTARLSTRFHSSFIYYDIYLDTPNFLLLQNGYSLRFRKRTDKGENPLITYSFQLKSEMKSLEGLRMEVEETELSFYQVQPSTAWVPITDVIDSVFYYVSHHSQQSHYDSLEKSLKLLTHWIDFKVEGAVAPFQKLLHLGSFSVQELKSLKPVLCGISKRSRSHVYTNDVQNENLSLSLNRIKLDDLPIFFRDNRNYNWLLETSLDESKFFNLNLNMDLVLEIKEFEVENKYFFPEKGTEILSVLEKDLMSKFTIKAKLNSKYKQAALKIH